jgi:3-phenylpropionate/cinnamic acid dioxygenase small subunit
VTRGIPFTGGPARRQAPHVGADSRIEDNDSTAPELSARSNFVVYRNRLDREQNVFAGGDHL